MKRFFLVLPCVAFVSGCGAVQQAQINSGMRQAEKASEDCMHKSIPPEVNKAWDAVFSESAEECPRGNEDTPLPQSRSMERHECWLDIVNKNVKPIEKKPQALSTLIAENKKVAEGYRDGKISRETGNEVMGRNLFTYMTKQVSHYSYAQCKNAALQQYVMPSYPHKGLLMSFMSHQADLGLKVDKREMSIEEADIAGQQAFAALLNAEQQANTATQQQNAQAWQQVFENSQRMEESRQRSMSTDTSCRMLGDTMHCSTH